MTKARSRSKHKGRGNGPSFVKLIHPLVKSRTFGELSGNAVKLYIELAMQYNGYNNGDLSATYKMLKDRGWKSKSTLWSAINELIKQGFIIRTRTGWKNKCSLYALTVYSIDECGGKLDISPTVVPLNAWKKVGEKK